MGVLRLGGLFGHLRPVGLARSRACEGLNGMLA